MQKEVSLSEMCNSCVHWVSTKVKITQNIKGPVGQNFEGPHNFSRAQIWAFDLKILRALKNFKGFYNVNICTYDHVFVKI